MDVVDVAVVIVMIASAVIVGDVVVIAVIVSTEVFVDEVSITVSPCL